MLLGRIGSLGCLLLTHLLVNLLILRSDGRWLIILPFILFVIVNLLGLLCLLRHFLGRRSIHLLSIHQLANKFIHFLIKLVIAPLIYLFLATDDLVLHLLFLHGLLCLWLSTRSGLVEEARLLDEHLVRLLLLNSRLFWWDW